MAKWKIDPQHSKVEFVVRHIMIVNVRGLFSGVSGTIECDPSDVRGLSVEATIDASSVWTGVPDRDDHIRSPDFLDVKTFPEIRFRSTAVEWTGSNRLKMTGDLFLHGVTRTVILDVENFGPVRIPPDDETCLGFSAAARLNREDFGMTWQWSMKDGGLVAGKYLEIILDVEADLIE